VKRVIVINQFALPRTEGGGTRHIDLFSRLTDWEPLILAGNRNHYSQQRFTTQDRRFRLIRVPRQSGGAVARLTGWLVFALQALTICLVHRRVDLFYGSSPHPFAAVSALVAARIRRKPFVLEIRDLWPESVVSAGKLAHGGLVHRVFSRIERLLVINADRIVCVTAGWEDHLSQLGVSGDRTVVVPNGTEPTDFEVAEDREVLRQSFSIDGFTAIFAGAQGPKDGIDLILEAARNLPNMNFLLVGSGPVKAACQRRARDQQITNVEFRDPVPKMELSRLLRACDVGIHAVGSMPVFQRGMSPNKLFDYMAAGLPIVSNAEEGVRRIIRDGECGRLGGVDELTL
jgi:glycosyltransferase involved in cell wall biosynthesis